MPAMHDDDIADRIPADRRKSACLWTGRIEQLPGGACPAPQLDRHGRAGFLGAIDEDHALDLRVVEEPERLAEGELGGEGPWAFLGCLRPAREADGDVVAAGKLAVGPVGPPHATTRSRQAVVRNDRARIGPPEIGVVLLVRPAGRACSARLPRNPLITAGSYGGCPRQPLRLATSKRRVTTLETTSRGSGWLRLDSRSSRRPPRR